MIQTYNIMNRLDTEEPELWLKRADSRRPTRQGNGKDRLLPPENSARVQKELLQFKSDYITGQFEPLYRRHLSSMVALANGAQDDRRSRTSHTATTSSSGPYLDQRRSSHKYSKQAKNKFPPQAPSTRLHQVQTIHRLKILLADTQCKVEGCTMYLEIKMYQVPCWYGTGPLYQYITLSGTNQPNAEKEPIWQHWRPLGYPAFAPI